MEKFSRLARFIPLVALLTLPSVSQAGFIGTLKSGSQVVVEVTGNSSNAGQTAVTIAKVVKQDRYEGVDAVSAFPNATVTANVAIGTSVQRLIISVNPPVGGSAFLRVTQGASLPFENQVPNDMVFVYDIEGSSSIASTVRVPPEDQ